MRTAVRVMGRCLGFDLHRMLPGGCAHSRYLGLCGTLSLLHAFHARGVGGTVAFFDAETHLLRDLLAPALALLLGGQNGGFFNTRIELVGARF